MVNKLMMKALRPSAIERLSKCSGSMRFLPLLGDEEQMTSYAQAGINAHQLLECQIKLMENGVIPVASFSPNVELEGVVVEIPEQDYVAVNACINRINNLIKSLTDSNPNEPVQVLSEQSVRIEALSVVGTADLVIIQGKTGIVLDYKNGKRPTSAVYQGLCYSVGALEQYKLDRVFFGVFQYGTSERDVIEFQQPYLMKELSKYNKTLTDLAEKAMGDDNELVVGAHCLTTYCPAVDVCPKIGEMMKRTEELIATDGDVVHWDIYRNSSLITNYMKNLNSKIRRHLNEGTPAQKAEAKEYVKIVDTKGTRTWSADAVENAKEAGLEDLTETKMVAITSIPKSNKEAQAFLKANIYTTAPGTKLKNLKGVPAPKSKGEGEGGLTKEQMAILRESA